ncbi:LLM class flavin-dependent oxidoreductase [Xinfangfangia sp. D13-10-4-6]|uniref:LLM class flavin-dependent oxidoreductase n=1 Tax=Pseudogemmobacter hezensis TaxID=2737662 RepID=UPI001551D654|nr:LLM class flavin-dependent oxidoreductase [Pseudogemmobacter hezensis]NPD14974.1 LLM class flavin-dependent oxidoreductase [Pseudogemmobacter hezensis]
MELGLYTFGDLPVGTIGPEAAHRRIQDIIAAAKLADEAGLSVFGVGEHHRPDYAVSAPEVMLGAIAAATGAIRLTTAVTILSSADPVRVFEQLATLDLVSNGRAEITVGRGAFIESFSLFGYALEDYDALYIEKLDLFLKLAAEERVTWQGHFRAPLQDAPVAPRPLSTDGRIWIGAGGTPESAVRAGKAGLPLNLANIGGDPARFKPFIDLYRRTGHAAGHDPSGLKVAISSHLHVQKDAQAARDAFYPHYARYIGHNLPNGENGWKVSRADYDQMLSLRGPLFVGSPQQIVDKILYERELFGHDRFMAQIDIGGLPFGKVANAIELLATDVLPHVRRAGPAPTGRDEKAPHSDR